MLQKIKATLVSVLLLATFGTATSAVSLTLVSPVAAHPVVADFKGDACGGISQLGGTGCGQGATSSISKLFKLVLELLSIIAGFIAVVMTILSGIKFATANGDASQISSARQSLIYALIGVVVAAISQILVVFVIGKTTKGL